MRLQTALDQFFLTALKTVEPHRTLDELSTFLTGAQTGFQSRMRVAFVGGVNKGKSTLMNAFLGEKLAETGNKELTCNVTWFRYGERPELLVHMNDGKTREPFASLAELTTRCDQSPDFVDGILYVEVRQPSDLLKHFDLIDTPGLYSAKKKNSEITKRFLTARETKPHAVVFLFSETLKEQDVKELAEFQSLDAGALTGINAIGALTKVDNLTHGFESAQQIIAQIKENHPWTLRRFYTIFPVAGQAAFGASTLTDADIATLRCIASLPQEQIEKILLDARDFCTGTFSSEEPTFAARTEIYERLGLWGVTEAVRRIRVGMAVDDVKKELMAVSGLDSLCDLVVSHFGNRAQLIQAATALQTVREAAFYPGERLRGPAQEAAHSIVRDIDRIIASEPRFREFGVLASYYRDELDLTAQDLEQLLDVTGEHGNSCAQKLGASRLEPAARVLDPIENLVIRARMREAYWRARAAEWVSPDLQNSYRILAESNAEIHVRLSKAAEHFLAAFELLG